MHKIGLVRQSPQRNLGLVHEVNLIIGFVVEVTTQVHNASGLSLYCEAKLALLSLEDGIVPFRIELGQVNTRFFPELAQVYLVAKRQVVTGAYGDLLGERRQIRHFVYTRDHVLFVHGLDDVADEHFLHLSSLRLLDSHALDELFFAVYVRQIEHEQVYGRGQYDQTEHDKQDCKYHIQRVFVQVVLFLQRHIITKTFCVLFCW